MHYGFNNSIFKNYDTALCISIMYDNTGLLMNFFVKYKKIIKGLVYLIPYIN